MNPLTRSKNTTILPVLIALTLDCFGLSPQARAVCQEGCLTDQNTVLGDDALLNNFGSANTAIGFNALLINTDGTDNTAIGDSALFNNDGSFNTATGSFAHYFNTTGSFNTATGLSALQSNTTGDGSTAIGTFALAFNTTGSGNIALGLGAGFSLTTGDNNIDIGNGGVAGESNTIRIGTQGTQTATFIAGIRGVPISGGTAVGVNSNGQLGQRASSARFKEAIQPMDKASEAIFSLQPVTFRYKKALDPKALPQFGLVAEEVAKVNPDLVFADEQGKPFTVRYEEVNAMLLNEFLKEHRKGLEQDATIRQLKTELAQQQKEIKALSAQIQKVSAQVELSKPAPQTVLNNQ
jgi:Chaperone of endosialidase